MSNRQSAFISAALCCIALAGTFACSRDSRGDASNHNGESPAGVAQPTSAINSGASGDWCASDSATTRVVTESGLGPITSAATREMLTSTCPLVGDTVVFGAEGMEVSASAIHLGAELAAILEWARDSMPSRLRLVSPGFRTQSGIAVGSSVGAIRATLGPLQAGYDDAGVFVWSDSTTSFSFLLRLRISELLPSPDDVHERPDVVPDTARVREVILGLRAHGAR
jgi:hypothetical protein